MVGFLTKNSLYDSVLFTGVVEGAIWVLCDLFAQAEEKMVISDGGLNASLNQSGT